MRRIWFAYGFDRCRCGYQVLRTTLPHCVTATGNRKRAWNRRFTRFPPRALARGSSRRGEHCFGQTTAAAERKGEHFFIFHAEFFVGVCEARPRQPGGVRKGLGRARVMHRRNSRFRARSGHRTCKLPIAATAAAAAVPINPCCPMYHASYHTSIVPDAVHVRVEPGTWRPRIMVRWGGIPLLSTRTRRCSSEAHSACHTSQSRYIAKITTTPESPCEIQVYLAPYTD